MKKPIAVIGNFDLVIECIEILEHQDFDVKYLFSETPSVLGWAKAKNILLAKDLKTFFDMVQQREIDYLFSIQNPFIIPNSVLSCVNKLAINYHNTLLPQYVGTKNNACWLIWFNEKESGITWHVMSNLVDGGDILKQKKFLLNKDETAFSLELKCQEQAKLALKELAIELQSGKVNRQSQDLSQRSVFYSFSRPCGFAVIHWNNTAETIHRQFRALDFGSQPNPITTLKFKYKGRYFVVLKMDILEHQTLDVSPGTIIDIKNESLQIATGSCDILVGYEALNDNDTFKISKGEILESEFYSLEKQREITEQVARDESYWKKLFSHFVPGKNFVQNEHKYFKSFLKLFEIKFSEFSSALFEPGLEDVLTLLLIYLYRVNNYEDCSLCISGKSIHIPEKTLQGLFLEVKPFNIRFEHTASFIEARKTITQLLNINEDKNVCFRDFLIRHPDFQEALRRNSILLDISEKAPIQNNIYPIIINLNEQNNSLSVFVANDFLEEMPFFLNFMQRHLENLAKNWIIENNPLNKINFLASQERQYLQDWNNTAAYFPDTQSVTAIIDDICKRFPQHIAIETKEQKISYQELKKYSDKMAQNILYFLRNQEMENNLIGVFLDKSANTILTFLSVLKAGLTYIVLDPSYPDTYLENVVQSTQAKIFISESSNCDRLQKIINNIGAYDNPIYLKLEKIFSEEHQDIKLPDNIPTTNLAYVLFTSGSTGTPKGVMIAQQGLINLAYAVISHIGLTINDKILQFSTLAFDASVWEIYSSLFSGATLYVPTALERFVGGSLKNTILDQAISVLMLSPSILATQPYFESNALKTIIAASENCPPTIPKKWGQYYRLINGYGPTETTVFATMSEPLKPNQKITIGKPIQNYQITICDCYQIELPIGAIGEIIISGVGVAEGYMNNADLTQQKFKTVSILGQEKKGYLSGDLGRWTKQGQIQYKGRADSQLKIRGFRIETTFIEKTISSYENVHVSIILPEKITEGELSLNAFITLNDPSAKLSLKSLRDFLAKKLPYFMIPKRFFLIDYLPLTASGKIDHEHLKNYLHVGLKELYEEAIYPPKTKLQKEIAALWQEIIRFNHAMDIHKEFSELGGTSLQITQMVLEIQKRYKVQISTADFLTRPTIKHLEKIILNKERNNNKCNLKQIIAKNLSEYNQFMHFSNSEFQISASKIKKVLITGASGFLGAYIAREFLSRDIEVFCLVREHFPYHHLKTTLSTYGWRAEEIQNLNILEGDISKEYFGLNLHLYNKLASEIDAICNSAAFVHHLFNYNQLKAANVVGVWQCLKFAETAKLKYFAHISTLSLLSGVKDWPPRENFIGLKDVSSNSLNGYNATKLNAEICITEALKKRPIKTKIYRAGFIGGDSITGAFAYKKNHLFLFLKGCLQLGLAPDWNTSINIIPVDYLARYIVSDMLNEVDESAVYNMVSSESILFKNFINYFAHRIENRVSFIPYEAWQKELKKLTEKNAIYQLAPLYLSQEDNSILNMYNLIEKVDYSLFSNNYSQLGLPLIPSINTLLPIYENFLLKEDFL